MVVGTCDTNRIGRRRIVTEIIDTKFKKRSLLSLIFLLSFLCPQPAWSTIDDFVCLPGACTARLFVPDHCKSTSKELEGLDEMVRHDHKLHSRDVGAAIREASYFYLHDDIVRACDAADELELMQQKIPPAEWNDIVDLWADFILSCKKASLGSRESWMPKSCIPDNDFCGPTDAMHSIRADFVGIQYYGLGIVTLPFDLATFVPNVALRGAKDSNKYFYKRHEGKKARRLALHFIQIVKRCKSKYGAKEGITSK
jgi:hypothetical protein